MTDPTPTELIERLHRASFGYETDESDGLYWQAKTALEAQLAETARLQAVINAGIRLADTIIDDADDINFEEDNYDAGRFLAADDIRATLASVGSSPALESVKADTTTEWGVRYGANDWPVHRVNQFRDQASCEQFIATPPMWADPKLYPNPGVVSRQVTEWLPVETEGESR